MNYMVAIFVGGWTGVLKGCSSRHVRTAYIKYPVRDAHKKHKLSEHLAKSNPIFLI